jgi:hypothetical protein
MFKRILRLLPVFILILILAPPAFASEITHFDDGWWDNAQFDAAAGTVSFDASIPSVGLYGTATQPSSQPGRAAHGTFEGYFDNGGDPIWGECAYANATFSLPSGKTVQPFRATFNQCTGGLAGLHMVMTGSIASVNPFEGPFEGSLHVENTP